VGIPTPSSTNGNADMVMAVGVEKIKPVLK
jgi:hypothetical protein